MQFKKDTADENWSLYYLRDKEGRELDFVITLNRRVHWLIEVKASGDDIGPSLGYYAKKLKPKDCLQLALNLPRARELRGVKVLPLGKWLEEVARDPRVR